MIDMTGTRESSCWIHVILKGEDQGNSSVDEKSQKNGYLEEFTRRSIKVAVIPPLQFRYQNLEQLKTSLVDASSKDTSFGIVVTSPRVVEALARATSMMNPEERSEFSQRVDSELIFPIGEKTARDLKAKTCLDYNMGAIKTGHALNLIRYIEEFCRLRQTEPIKLIYPKGSLANQSFEENLGNVDNLEIQSIVVYVTSVNDNLSELIVEKLDGLLPKSDQKININFICFSPSGVQGLKRDIDKIKGALKEKKIDYLFSSIGATTEMALQSNGFEVFCVANEPNSRSLIDCISDKCRELEN